MPKYPVEPIAVEYDSRGKRVRKEFTDHFEARRFYATKFKAGRNPRVLKVRAPEA